MPILIADQWNALREGIASDTDGSQYFTGKIIITFFLDKQHKSHCTGLIRKVVVEQNTCGKVEKVQKKDENGKNVTVFYKTLYEHQAAVDKVTKSATGFSGWMFNLSEGNIVCLPKGRSETRDEEQIVDPPKDAPKDTKPKTKIVQVKTQPEALLDKIFTVKK